MAALLFTLLAVLLFSSTQGLNAADHGSTLKLFHVNSPLMPQNSDSLLDTLLQTQSNDEARYKYLSSHVVRRKDAVPISRSNTYVVQAMIGTSAQKLLLAVDTNIDAGLVACYGNCHGARCPRVTFDRRRSTTLKTIGYTAKQCRLVPNPSFTYPPNCWFTTQYNNYTVKAELMQDNIGLGTYSFTNYAFGCAFNVDVNYFPVQGLLGLGRGKLSLLSQTNLSTFSYCLPSYMSANPTAGSLILGPKKYPAKIKTTPLLTIPKRPTLYAVKLNAIVVDKLLIRFPRGGPPNTVMDTGTVFTTLIYTMYQKVIDHVRNLMRGEFLFKLGTLDTCYHKPINVTTMTFMFDGMNMTLPPKNIIIKVGNSYCLAMAPTPDNVNSGLNIIASYQQQNFRVLINANSLGVVRETCT